MIPDTGSVGGAVLAPSSPTPPGAAAALGFSQVRGQRLRACSRTGAGGASGRGFRSSDPTLSQSRGEDGRLSQHVVHVSPKQGLFPGSTSRGAEMGGLGLACRVPRKCCALQQKYNGCCSARLNGYLWATRALRTWLPLSEGRPWLRGGGSQKSRCQESSPGSTLGSCEGADRSL